MKKKQIIFISSLVLALCPVIILGQDTGDANQMLQFLKGDGTFEDWFMNGFAELDTSIAGDSAEVAMVGKAIGVLGAIMYLGYMGWQMASGDREWEITPMLRPIFIAMILSNWSSFTSLIQYPFQKASQPSKEIFASIENKVNDKRIIRFKKQTQIIDALVKHEASLIEQKYEDNGEDKGWIEQLGDSFSKKWEELKIQTKELGLKLNIQMQRFFAELVEAGALTFLRICTYFIFFVQKLWSYLLIVLGPIAVGMSMIPGFESSLYSWISKFININLYTFVAYTTINIGQQLIMTAYEMEIKRYGDIVNDSGDIISEELLLAFGTNTGILHTLLFTVVAYCVTGIGILMTPSIADSIVSGGVGAMTMSKMKQNAGKIASMASSPYKSWSANRANQRQANISEQRHNELVNAIKGNNKQ